MDFAANHSSDTHEWFQKSVDRIEPYDKYYLWADAKGRNDAGELIPPNNWVGFDFYKYANAGPACLYFRVLWERVSICTGESFRRFSLGME